MNKPVKKHIPAFLIAAPKSNSGKTIITLGLIKAFINRGYKVQPFKCGPDYIDTQYHSQIAGTPSFNLDLWMASPAHVKDMFSTKAFPADMAIVEGVMGLFDGAIKDKGSSAELAKMLDIPVILVIDAASMAYSAAPLIWGFKNFDANLKMAGVIFNKVSNSSHYSYLQQAARDAGVKSLGFIPKDERLILKSRHLGLYLPGEQDNSSVELAAKLIEEHIDLDLLLHSCKKEIELFQSSFTKSVPQQLKIAYARDDAFNFSYQANIDRLAEFGDVQFFSPLHDKQLPYCDLLWLPGGYPELFCQQLSQNSEMMQQIQNHAVQNRAVIAECGGMMYAGTSFIDKDGKAYNMTGIIDLNTSLENMKLHLGYRKVSYNETIWCGHEFHFSSLVSATEPSALYEISNAKGENTDMAIFRKGNIWASYMHLYLGEKKTMTSFLSHLGVIKKLE